MSHIVSVNVGRPRTNAWSPDGWTAMEKAAVTGRVEVGPLGLAGDEVAHKAFHGGIDKAVYAFAREDLDRWADVLGMPVPDGHFGENLTTLGVDVNGAELGERWRVGDGDGPVLEVASFRTPCQTFKAWMGHTGYDNRAWVRRFALDARPGAYLRVVVPGVLQVGDAVEVVHRPGTDVTVAGAFRRVLGLES